MSWTTSLCTRPCIMAPSRPLPTGSASSQRAAGWPYHRVGLLAIGPASRCGAHLRPCLGQQVTDCLAAPRGRGVRPPASGNLGPMLQDLCKGRWQIIQFSPFSPAPSAKGVLTSSVLEGLSTSSSLIREADFGTDAMSFVV